jgi:predicted GIY-YIG superfamily endonuclease
MTFWTYILRCADGSYYTGHTDDLDRRLSEHAHGLCPGYTLTRRPVTLMYSADMPDRDSAFHLERQIKGWSRAKKEALFVSDWNRLSALAVPPSERADRLVQVNP